jgi:hypothetical protein
MVFSGLLMVFACFLGLLVLSAAAAAIYFILKERSK